MHTEYRFRIAYGLLLVCAAAPLLLQMAALPPYAGLDAPIVIPALLAPALARWRMAAWWLVAWDVIITEIALFHDFAGVSSAAHGSLLFRWGPLQPPFTAHLSGIGVGPLAAWTTALRLVHLSAFFSLESILHESMKQPLRLNDRNTDIARDV
jgi:hypothetical protein